MEQKLEQLRGTFNRILSGTSHDRASSFIMGRMARAAKEGGADGNPCQHKGRY